MTAIFQANVEEFWRDGYLTAPSVLSDKQLVQMRTEADRLLQMFATNPERYPRRIQWEKNYLSADRQTGMERAIRKLEPISDLSPIFAELAYVEPITGPVSAIFGEPVEVFEDKL